MGSGHGGSGEDNRHIDRAIGERIRRRRVELGLTQDQLACRLKISYQQVQKYERGANRISASRLYELALRLDVAPGYFFVDLAWPDDALDHGGHDRPAIEIARQYHRIRNPSVRTALAGLMRAVLEREDGHHEPGDRQP